MATNEDLAQRIQSGERALLPDLWEGVRGFVYQNARRWWNTWQPYRPGLEVDDLAHGAYIAMSERIGEFDPARGAFLSWLKYVLLTAFCVEVGCRTPAQLKRPEGGAVSLNAPVGGEDEDLTLGGVLEDRGASLTLEATLEGVYNAQAARIVGQALDKLPERQRAVIRGRYYEGKTLREISAAVGVSVSAIQQEEHYAFRQLRKDRELWKLRDFNPYRGTGLNAWRQTGFSVQERIAMELEALEEMRRRPG